MFFKTFFFFNYGFLPDSLSRLNLNDTNFNSFFFFWTSFLYLPSFFFFLFYIVSFYLYPNKFYAFITILFYLYNTEIWDFINFNSNLILQNTLALEFNILLTNLLNKIHPLIFYLNVTFALVGYFQWCGSLRLMKNFTHPYLIFLYHPLRWFNLSATTSSLLLGSWWALQEGTWGGW